MGNKFTSPIKIKSMFKSIIILTALMFAMTISRAQTAMQLTGSDCNGVNHNLFSDLDSGRAVILFFFMDNCGSCPPPAQKIQSMTTNLLKRYPGKIKGYVMPYNNSTTCTATKSWVSNNNLSFYIPYDSGAVQVANYGGFGMPTVVLVGGKDHRVIFSTQSFTTPDTAIMRDSIVNLLDPTAAVKKIGIDIHGLNLFPNPSTGNIGVSFFLQNPAILHLEVIDISGKIQKSFSIGNVAKGQISQNLDVHDLNNGMYFLRIIVNGESIMKEIIINK